MAGTKEFYKLYITLKMMNAYLRTNLHHRNALPDAGKFELPFALDRKATIILARMRPIHITKRQYEMWEKECNATAKILAIDKTRCIWLAKNEKTAPFMSKLKDISQYLSLVLKKSVVPKDI